MFSLYEALLYQPIYNLLIFLYNVIPYKDIGVSIILLTIVVKLALHPFTKKSIQSQKELQGLQPKLEALKKEHGANKEKLASEMMRLYKEHKVNPFSSCLPLLIQLPFIIAVYQVFQLGLGAVNFDLLYSFIGAPASVNTMLFGFLDLTKPQISLAVLAAVSQFAQTRMLVQKQPDKDLREKEGAKDENMLALMNKNMTYMMPILTLLIGMSLPGGLTLYWLVSTLATLLQQLTVYKKNKSDKGDSNSSSGAVIVA